jgi:acyl phosphate:glycerol-3-phosphate acyltransferase
LARLAVCPRSLASQVDLTVESFGEKLRSVLVVILAYLIGSIPFGYLLVRVKYGADIRETGSGGTGATNVSRRAGKLAGLLVLFLDAAKGALAVILARLLLGVDGLTTWPVGISALAVLIGHIFPVWLRFRGGKGVATAVGVFLVLAPTSLALAGILFLVVALTTRYVSLASMLAAVAIPLLVWLQLYLEPARRLDSFVVLVIAIVTAILIIFAHRSNVGRLIHGTESKFQ